MTFGTDCIVLPVQLFDVGREKTALASLRGRFAIGLTESGIRHAGAGFGGDGHGYE